MKHKILLPFFLFFLALNDPALADQDSRFNYVSPQGVVPDSVTAIQIAKAVLIPIYGKDKIQSEEPFVATLHDKTWTVTGTLSNGLLGGVSEIDISKSNACVLRISHGE